MAGFDFRVHAAGDGASAISFRASFTDNSGISFFRLVEHAGTSVSKQQPLWPSGAPGHRAGKVSALTLKAVPVFEVASGASTESNRGR